VMGKGGCVEVRVKRKLHRKIAIKNLRYSEELLDEHEERTGDQHPNIKNINRVSDVILDPSLANKEERRDMNTYLYHQPGVDIYNKRNTVIKNWKYRTN